MITTAHHSILSYKPVESSPQPHTLFHFNIISHLRLPYVRVDVKLHVFQTEVL